MDIHKQMEIIRRGAAEIISEEELKKKLEQSLNRKRPLRVKVGFDPTAPDIHLGHTVLLRKMRQFQDLGHQVIFLIGDFTGMIGDPSGQDKMRRRLSEKEVKENAATYKKQVFKILDSGKTRVAFNSAWFRKMNSGEILNLASYVTLAQILARQDFNQRYTQGRDISLLEFYYPLLQAYDSVRLEADIEIGGIDQKFNLLLGRELQKDFNQAPQAVIMLPLLEGTDGAQKMSKSFGNYIGINESSDSMFGKIMSISDELMFKYYQLLTDEDLEQIKKMHPKEAKLRLAENIIAQYHCQKAASLARQEFLRVFSQKELPKEVAEYKIGAGQTIVVILVNSGLVNSGNEARRLISQRAVFFDNSPVDKENFTPQKSGILKVGARRFLRLVI
ncbi:MAG: tyrosine--tRNA ligase [Candidatus Omnitrophica bacterium]|nr:tyrosine--tRNA ligase [Candidatus Omnitrophota bacterium]